MVRVIFDFGFRKKFEKISDKAFKDKIIKQMIKIKTSPEIGKPVRYSRKGTREVYIKPYRLSYIFNNDTITFADIYHKDEQ